MKWLCVCQWYFWHSNSHTLSNVACSISEAVVISCIYLQANSQSDWSIVIDGRHHFAYYNWWPIHWYQIQTAHWHKHFLIRHNSKCYFLFKFVPACITNVLDKMGMSVCILFHETIHVDGMINNDFSAMFLLAMVRKLQFWLILTVRIKHSLLQTDYFRFFI